MDDHSDFLASYQKLPEPGGYVTRLPGTPCAGCGAVILEVAYCRREFKMQDGEIRRSETVDVQCGRCSLETARTVIAKRVIGMFDTASGTLTIGK